MTKHAAHHPAACLKMKNLVVLLLVLVAAAISRTYAQARYPAMMIPVANGVCPLHADREAAIDQIKADVRNILRNYSIDICDGTSGWNKWMESHCFSRYV